MKNVSIRSRLALLVVVCALPALGLSIYHGLERRTHAELSAREDLQRLAALAARQQDETIEGVRQLLLAVAGTAGFLRRERTTCQDFFKRLVNASGGLYHSMSIHDADGNLVCDAAGAQDAENARDKRHFRLAVDARRFAIGEFQVGRASGLKGISFGSPVLDSDRRLLGVVSAGIDLTQLKELATRAQLPESGRLIVLDRNATVLARQPDTAGIIGEKVRNPRIIEALKADEDQLFEAKDTDGGRRLFATHRVGSNPDGSSALRVVVSVPQRVIFSGAYRALIQTTAGILVATLVLVLGAWYGTELVVARRIRAMLNVAHRIRTGDLTARTRFSAEDEEFAEVGNALDEMAEALQKREAELKQALRELSEQVITDPLTGLNNRRYLWDFLRRDLLRARRAVLPVAAILFDIDHFKRFNDTWGHEAGDRVLKSAAKVVKQNVRGSDIACRYGGEEFVVILPEATLKVAIDRAEKIRHGIEEMKLTSTGKPLDRVTASFGIALFPTHAGDEEALLRAADEALYQAKAGGRNRVQVYQAKPSLL